MYAERQCHAEENNTLLEEIKSLRNQIFQVSLSKLLSYEHPPGSQTFIFQAASSSTSAARPGALRNTSQHATAKRKHTELEESGK